MLPSIPHEQQAISLAFACLICTIIGFVLGMGWQ